MQQQRPSTTAEHSAGGVLWRPPATPGGEVEICLVATRGRSRWQIPKGHPAEGETEQEAARREVREETGCAGLVEDDIGEIVYWFYAGKGPHRHRVRKSVRFFLLSYQSGDTSGHDSEVDDARWFTASEANRRLTFASERDVLERALARLRGRQPPTAGC